MASVTFDIDGYIGGGAYSRQYVKSMMKGAGKDPVNVNISSLGGDINHGIGIHDIFVDHKNVNARLSGFVASAATVIACGAKHIKINSTAFYLIHKVSGWIDEFGFKNEDELQDLINKFEQDKEENKKIDLVIAQIYAHRTGKAINDIVDLMKKSTWLNAREALEWGFVDEIVMMAGKENLLTDSKVAMIEAAGLPLPARRHDAGGSPTTAETSTIIENTAKSVLDQFKSFFSNSQNQPKKMDKKKFLPLLNAINVQDAELDKDGGIYINAEQLNALVGTLAKIDEAKTARQTAEQAQTDLVNQLDEIDPAVKEANDTAAKITAIREKLAAKAGTPPTNQDGGDTDPKGEDWDTIDKLPHNQAVDNMIL